MCMLTLPNDTNRNVKVTRKERVVVVVPNGSLHPQFLCTLESQQFTSSSYLKPGNSSIYISQLPGRHLLFVLTTVSDTFLPDTLTHFSHDCGICVSPFFSFVQVLAFKGNTPIFCSFRIFQKRLPSAAIAKRGDRR